MCAQLRNPSQEMGMTILEIIVPGSEKKNQQTHEMQDKTSQ